MRADGAAQLADATRSERLRETLFRAAEFVVHQRQLQPESDRLRVNAMAAADHRRHFVTPRLSATTRRSSRMSSSRILPAASSCTARVVSRISDDVRP